MSAEPFAVLVHGGAGKVAQERLVPAREGCRRAARRARRVLASGGAAEDAVVEAILELEADPTFNAGHGACMNEKGEFETDAGIMRSRGLRSGGVGAVAGLVDPIRVAREVMIQSGHRLLVGEGALAFAREHGVGRVDAKACWTRKAQDNWDRVRAGREADEERGDTVGAVALDKHGNLAAGGSTGGVLMKTPGRVGDTPIPGAGLWAHPRWGAAAATGRGEAIMAHLMCHRLLFEASPPQGPETKDWFQRRAEALCDEVRGHRGAAVGLIALRPDGTPAWAHACAHMSWGYAAGDASVLAGFEVPREAQR